MTSMIDCVFLLLIFFVCASVGQLRESMLGTDLPPGGVSASVVDVELEGNNRRYRSFAELRATLRELASLAPEIPVILDIGGEVPLGDVIDVYDTCREARFRSIHFATGPAA